MKPGLASSVLVTREGGTGKSRDDAIHQLQAEEPKEIKSRFPIPT